MKKILSQEPVIKSRTVLTVAAYFFALFLCFAGSLFIRARELGFPHLILLQLVAFFLPLMLYKLSEVGREESLSLYPFKAVFLPKIFLWVLALSLIFFALHVFFDESLTLYGASFHTPKDVYGWVMFLLAFVILPSFGEELLLRGAWQDCVEKSHPFGSVFASAIMSAAFGFRPFACAFLLLSGACSALIKMQSSSSYASLLFSLLLRSSVLLAVPMVPTEAISPTARMITATISLVLGVVCVFFAFDKNAHRSFLKKTQAARDASQKAKLFALSALVAFLGVGFIFLRFAF